ncbi:MAG TPA: phosphatidate cytidylyltransferase [Tepidisphaeraceae bacterium]|jgi:phosphatidate cytidylyltransferase
MNSQTQARLFGYSQAFADPATRLLVGIIVVVLVTAGVAIGILAASKIIGPNLKSELFKRYFAWLIIVPLMIGPVLLGAAWAILAITILSLLCYREFARATGLFREKLISLFVVIGILLLNFAALDNWYGFFVALNSLCVGIIAVITILRDRPQGYIQRVALSVFAFMLFGVCLSHLSYMANDPHYRAILIMLVMTVELNDVFAFCVGKTLGRHKLAPNTSPNKTIEGSLGAAILTTILVTWLGHNVFYQSPLDDLPHLIGLGLIISLVGQLGDLLLSSIKRDLSIKDMGTTIPGHGGFLDRTNSLLLVAPAVFHYVGYFVGFGLDQQKRIFSAGW